MGRDYFSLVRTAIPQHVKAVLNDSESGAVSSAMSEDGVGSGLVVALEAVKPLGRTRLIKSDAVKNLVCNTPKALEVSAGGVERVRYEVEKQNRTWRCWFEGESEDLNFKVLPDAVRHTAWQITHRHVRSDGKKQIERMRRRLNKGRVLVFVKVDHLRDTQRAAGTSKLYDEWSLRLRMGQILVSDGHLQGYTNERSDRRCRSIWKCPEELRRVTRKLNKMVGDPWNTSPRQEEEPRIN